MRSSTCVILACVILAVGLRLATILLLPDSIVNAPENDPDSFARFGRTLAIDGVFGPAPDAPSAFRPPFYSLLIGPWLAFDPPWTWGIVALHLLASAATVLLTWQIATSLGAGRWALLAALLVAVDPLLIRQSTLLMTETVFTALFLGMIAGWIGDGAKGRRFVVRAILGGLLLGLAGLTRPIAWATWALLAPAAWWEKRTREWLLTLAIALLVAAPWMARNYFVIGRPLLTTTHGGYTLWLGQNPTYYEHVVVGKSDRWPDGVFEEWTIRNGRETEGMPETQKDAYFRKRATDWMTEHPAQAARSIAYRAWSLWRPAPQMGPSALRLACGAFSLALYALAFLGLTRRSAWSPPALALPICLLAFTLVHGLYWSDVRMRAPLEPVLAILATVGARALWTRP